MPVPLTNLLLESLPPSERAWLARHLEPVALPVRTVLFEAEQLPRYVYLITSGMASVVAPMDGGDSMEVGVVGREGLPGAILLLGPQAGPTRSFMQVGGTGLRIPYARFQEAFFQYGGLQRRVLEYVQAETLILGQLSACNRLHEVEERLSRWLLMVADRTGLENLPLTQEFLAGMLGARRSTVTIVAGTLQRAGLIQYTRGNVTIIDADALRNAACECYPIVRSLHQNLYRKSLSPEGLNHDHVDA